MKMKSVMNHSFAKAPTVTTPRSVFNRSHGFKSTFDAGYLVPIFNDLAIPGDSMQLNVTGFGRLSTPTYPIMDNMIMDTFFFAVPIRLIWDNFKKQMGEQVDPGDSISYACPQITLNNVSNETLYDYFGFPTKIAANYTVNNFLGRSYNLIWNTWFRDENLQDSAVVDHDDGPDNSADYVLLRRNKRHDYFTSCLPQLQKGDAVQLSLGTVADVVPSSSPTPRFTIGTDTDLTLRQDGASNVVWGNSAGSPTGTDGYWQTTGLETDLSTATASTVNELRQAIQIQRLLERDMRSGTRYIEIIKSHYGVSSEDMRHQRPEYLGGGSTPINISPVARTDSSPGALGAVGTMQFRGHGFSKSFTEHCIVIGMACIRADLNYQEGIERWHDIQTRYDWYWPSLAHLGEMAVLNREIYIDAATIGAGTDDDVFGYQERYADLKYKPSKITGKLRSNDAASLDAWHLAVEFGATPTLDDTFMQENPPIDRVIVTPTEPHFIYDSYLNYRHTRPIPVYSIPGYIDHF